MDRDSWEEPGYGAVLILSWVVSEARFDMPKHSVFRKAIWSESGLSRGARNGQSQRRCGIDPILDWQHVRKTEIEIGQEIIIDLHHLG